MVFASSPQGTIFSGYFAGSVSGEKIKFTISAEVAGGGKVITWESFHG